MSDVQAGLLDQLAGRETIMAGWGNVREEAFQTVIVGSVEPVTSTGKESRVEAIIECNFATGYSDPPLLVPDVSVKWADMDGSLGGVNYDPSYAPMITACVMNWRRAVDHRLYIGAHVSIRVYDHPWEAELFVRLQFIGNAIATPLQGIGAVEDTTIKDP